MKASPLLACFTTRAYEFGLCGDLTVALKALQPQAAETYLADLSGLHKFLIVGAGAPAWLGTQGFAAPALFARKRATDGRWVTRLGAARYLLSEGPSSVGQITITPGRLAADVLVLAQDSVEIALGGPGARAVLSEFCAIDLATYTEDVWVPLQLAQLDIGLYRRADAFHLICAPADAQSLFSVLAEALRAAGGVVVGFADYQQIIRGGMA